mmetsp:Transcript_42423/g.76048  ORF Transcript_42423/g.76048 Transcript_42423/m.76048 type:complete len:201 (-) Transcript_42423:315-917(-)
MDGRMQDVLSGGVPGALLAAQGAADGHQPGDDLLCRLRDLQKRVELQHPQDLTQVRHELLLPLLGVGEVGVLHGGQPLAACCRAGGCGDRGQGRWRGDRDVLLPLDHDLHGGLVQGQATASGGGRLLWGHPRTGTAQPREGTGRASMPAAHRRGGRLHLVEDRALERWPVGLAPGDIGVVREVVGREGRRGLRLVEEPGE